MYLVEPVGCIIDPKGPSNIYIYILVYLLIDLPTKPFMHTRWAPITGRGPPCMPYVQDDLSPASSLAASRLESTLVLGFFGPTNKAGMLQNLPFLKTYPP